MRPKLLQGGMIRSVSPLLSSIAVAATILVWAAAFPAIRLALMGIEPLPLAAIRFAMAASFGVVWLCWNRPRRMPLGDILLCSVCGVIGAAGYSVLLNFGQETVSAGAASFLVKTESLWMAIFGVLFLKENFSAWAWAGTIAGLTGVGIIASGEPGGIEIGAGAPMVLAAAFCSGTGFVLQRKLVKRHGATHVASIMFIVAAIALSPWLPVAFAQIHEASTAVYVSVIFLGIFPTTVGLVCWNYALGYFGAARAGNFLYVVAPLATIIAWILFGETPALTTLAGGVFILVGVIMVNVWGHRKITRRSNNNSEQLVIEVTPE